MRVATWSRGPMVADRETSANRTKTGHSWKIGTPEAVPAPILILMAGFAGSGKTTLARKLREEFAWDVVNKDEFKLERLAAQNKDGMTEDEWCAFVNQAGWDAFEELLDRVRANLVEGKSLIVDTSNEKPHIFKEIKKIRKQCRQNKVCLLIILCDADEETRTKRLEKRKSVFWPYVKELPDILADSEFEKRFEHVFREKHVIRVNTACPLNEYVNAVIGEIRDIIRNCSSIKEGNVLGLRHDMHVLLKTSLKWFAFARL